MHFTVAGDTTLLRPTDADISRDSVCLTNFFPLGHVFSEFVYSNYHKQDPKTELMHLENSPLLEGIFTYFYHFLKEIYPVTKTEIS